MKISHYFIVNLSRISTHISEHVLVRITEIFSLNRASVHQSPTKKT